MTQHKTLPDLESAARYLLMHEDCGLTIINDWGEEFYVGDWSMLGRLVSDCICGNEVKSITITKPGTLKLDSLTLELMECVWEDVSQDWSSPESDPKYNTFEEYKKYFTDWIKERGKG